MILIWCPYRYVVKSQLPLNWSCFREVNCKCKCFEVNFYNKNIFNNFVIRAITVVIRFSFTPPLYITNLSLQKYCMCYKDLLSLINNGYRRFSTFSSQISLLVEQLLNSFIETEFIENSCKDLPGIQVDLQAVHSLKGVTMQSFLQGSKQGRAVSGREESEHLNMQTNSALKFSLSPRR